jgi:hypothetical protein
VSCVEWEIDIVGIKLVAAPAVVAFDVARRFSLRALLAVGHRAIALAGSN